MPYDGRILKQGPSLTWRSWAQVQKYIDTHKDEIPAYKIERSTTSSRAALVYAKTGEVAARTVTEAEELVKFR
jgi:hypothetical protein